MSASTMPATLSRPAGRVARGGREELPDGENSHRPTGQLGRQIAGNCAPTAPAERRIGSRHRGVEVDSGHRPERDDDGVEHRGGSRRVLEQLEPESSLSRSAMIP